MMRPLVLLVLFIIVLVSVRVDLTAGTIPQYDMTSGEQAEPSSTVHEEPEPPEEALTYQEVVVEPGQTVYSVVQKLHEPEPFTIPLHDVLVHFEQLNPGVSSHNLLAGEVYKFPVYMLQEAE